MDRTNPSGSALLHQIANALNVPMEQFFNKDLPGNVISEQSECLRIWFEIRTAEGRLRALEALWMIAAEEDLQQSNINTVSY